MTLQDIKETKRYGRTHGRTDRGTDNVKTEVCGGYKQLSYSFVQGTGASVTNKGVSQK